VNLSPRRKIAKILSKADYRDAPSYKKYQNSIQLAKLDAMADLMYGLLEDLRKAAKANDWKALETKFKGIIQAIKSHEAELKTTFKDDQDMNNKAAQLTKAARLLCKSNRDLAKRCLKVAKAIKLADAAEHDVDRVKTELTTVVKMLNKSFESYKKGDKKSFTGLVQNASRALQEVLQA